MTASNSDVPKRRASLQTEQTELQGQQVTGKLPASEEVDENGYPFITSSNGTTIFGEITEDTGLPNAPIERKKRLCQTLHPPTSQKVQKCLIHTKRKKSSYWREHYLNPNTDPDPTPITRFRLQSYYKMSRNHIIILKLHHINDSSLQAN